MRVCSFASAAITNYDKFSSQQYSNNSCLLPYGSAGQKYRCNVAQLVLWSGFHESSNQGVGKMHSVCRLQGWVCFQVDWGCWMCLAPWAFRTEAPFPCWLSAKNFQLLCCQYSLAGNLPFSSFTAGSGEPSLFHALTLSYLSSVSSLLCFLSPLLNSLLIPAGEMSMF